jgi:pSer/pThr/pTyr-binding forkhead associated (FHA) protein
VGRTANNDIFVDDVQLSRFHAFFKQNGAQWELSDAGSLNGTKLRGQALVAKGPAKTLQPGDLITFGAREFVFMTASATWDRLIDAMDRWDR